MDRAGVIVETSSSCPSLLGARSADDLKNVRFESVVAPEHRPRFAALFEKVLRGQSGELEARITRRDGEPRWMELHAGPIENAQGALDAVLAVAHDVSRRKRIEDDLAIKTELLTAASEGLAACIERSDWQAATRRLLLTAMKLTRSEYGFVGVLIEGSSLRVLAYEGFSWDETRNREFYERALRQYEQHGYLEFPHLDTLFGRALTTGEVVIANDPQADPRAAGRLPDGHPPLRSFLGVPISTGKQAIGIVALANRPGGYSEREKDQIEVLVQHVHGLCTTYRDHVAASTLQQERLQMATALQASEERLSLAVDAANIGLWDWDLRTQKVVFSREWKRQLGLEDEEVGDAFSEWERRVHPEDACATFERLQAYLADPHGMHEVEFRMRHRDGSWRWMSARGRAVRDERGAPVRMCGCHIEITARKQAEARLVRLNRTHSVLTGTHQVILREHDPQRILDQACHVAVKRGGFMLAWIGLAHRDIAGLQIAAHAGASPDTVEILRGMFSDPDQGCAFTAGVLHGRVHAVCNDIASDPLAQPWRDAALQRGYRSMVSLALTISDRRIGALNLYAPEPGFFDAEELRLLDALAEDIAFALDVGERERERTAAVERLRISEERFRELTETIEDAFWISDAVHMNVDYVSQAYEKIWGRTRQSLYEAPRSWLEAIHPEDRARVEAAVQILQRGGSYNETFRIHRADGAERWIRDQAFPVRNARGEIERLVGVARDITERRMLEEHLRQAQKLETVGELAGGIAHDFNNLVGAILGNAQLAELDLPAGHPARESVTEIVRAGKRAMDLVKRLLTFSRPQEHQLRPLQVGHVLEEAVALLRPMVPAAIELRLHRAPCLPAINGDASQIHQIVLNLVTNSWQAMAGSSGRIEIVLASRSIDERTACATPELRPGAYVVLALTDTGPGMDAATLNRIFEPFFTTKAPGTGTGLGLPVVQQIMRNHRGTIAVDSERGRGTTFQLFFPAISTPASEETTETAAQSEGAGRGQHILYVDDEEPLVDLGKRLLARAGYRVSAHTSARTALAQFERAPGAYDLVITDLNMPEMSGIELTRRLRSANPSLPIVLTSGHVTPEEITKAHTYGVSEVISKPASIEDLLRTVERLLSSSQ